MSKSLQDSGSQTMGRDPFEGRQFPEKGRQTMKLRIFSQFYQIVSK
jgi:hypothetical protein